MNFSKLNILVIGDIMLDTFTFTLSKRFSPEDKNVPVLTPIKRFSTLGGAANVAANLKALGANSIDLIGVVGDDIIGEEILKMLESKDISTCQILINNFSPSTHKERFFLEKKHIFRFDNEKKIENGISHKITKKIKKIKKKYDAIILSDYNKGVLNENNIPQIIDHFDCPVMIDPKKNDFKLYRNATSLTPNIKELEKATGLILDSEKSIENACYDLISQYSLDFIVLTRGEKGISLIGKDIVFHIDGHAVIGADVTGAGDSVISALTLTYALTNNLTYASKVANLAGSISVSKRGTSTISIYELKEKIKEKGIVQ